MLIKICGMSEQPVIDRAAALGADMCGFIFHPASPRCVSPAQAAGLDTHGMARVGVFVEQGAEEIAAIMRGARLDYVQLHGGQSAAFASLFPAKKVIRVLWPNRCESLEALQADIDAFAPTCGLYLLDAGMGSGITLDWPSLSRLRFPHPWMLSGGLGPDNVREALAACSPDGLDLNSRLESSPGRKDMGLMEKFFATLPHTKPEKGESTVERKTFSKRSLPSSNSISKVFPMKKGYFGDFGGCFVPELLMPPLMELEQAMVDILPSEAFQHELRGLLHDYAGRETPVTFCPTLSRELGFELWLKREDLLHTGAHKINNTLGQALLAKHMGKSALIAETGAGQHGVATAAAAARLGLRCTVFMGAEDVERQSANVRRMRLLGAEVHAVESGSRTLKDAINAALRAWIASQTDTHYCFGTAAGPYPFPDLVREFQSVIGREARAQMLEHCGALPDSVVAAVGGGSNAIGMFVPFVEDSGVRLIGVEAGGTGEEGCPHSAAINLGRPGVLHGEYTMLLQDEDGQILPSSSISAGLDYPGVGPEHVYLHTSGRVKYGIAYDREVLNAFQTLCRCEGILPALESSHALAWVLEHREEFRPGSRVLVCLSGRGDKDMDIIEQALGL